MAACLTDTITSKDFVFLRSQAQRLPDYRDRVAQVLGVIDTKREQAQIRVQLMKRVACYSV